MFTEAETIDELKKRVQDAVRCHFDPSEMPSHIRLGDESLALHSSTRF
jgi:hypothetical protein